MQTIIRGYTREGGREFVKEHTRHGGGKFGLSPKEAGKMAAAMIASGKKNQAVKLQALPYVAFKAPVSHLGAEALAKAAYNPGSGELPGGYQAAETFADPKTGLAVSIFVSPKAKTVIAFRGTEGAGDVRDVLTDVDPRGVGFGQFENNRQALSEIAAKYPGATITGHSLGGALAQRYAAEFSGAGEEIITFNAPGIDKRTAAKFQKGKTKVTHYVSEGDPVSLGGEQFIDGEAKIISYKSGKIPIFGNTLDKHMAVVTSGLVGMKDAQVKTISAAELSNPNFKYGGMRTTGFTDRRAIENRRKLAGIVSAPLQPVVGLAGQALGMIGIGK